MKFHPHRGAHDKLGNLYPSSPAACHLKSTSATQTVGFLTCVGAVCHCRLGQKLPPTFLDLRALIHTRAPVVHDDRQSRDKGRLPCAQEIALTDQSDGSPARLAYRHYHTNW